MKKIGLGLLALTLVGSIAHAVSIDFTIYSAVTIGELQINKSEDGKSTYTEIEFSGAGLKPLMALLPEVKSMDGEKEVVMENLRMFNITNAGQEGITYENETSIYFECENSENKDVPNCKILIIKGVIPG